MTDGLAIRELNPDTDVRRCEAIVGGLPEFFGVETGIAECSHAIATEPGLVAVHDETVVGFLTYLLHNPRSAEITWMAVDPAVRHSGIGRDLVGELTDRLGSARVEMLSVKTSAGPRDATAKDSYAPTRVFYERVGFVPQMPLDIWDTEHALLYVRPLRDARVRESPVSEARLILTCGLPGSGKTLLARQLAADRSAVRLTKDEWLWALGTSPWDEPTRKKVEAELWRLAQQLLRLGVSVVLDFGLWARAERDELRAAARSVGVGIELHYLDVPADELWRRIEARNSKPPWDNHPIRRTDLDGWLGVFQAPGDDELALFDPPPTT